MFVEYAFFSFMTLLGSVAVALVTARSLPRLSAFAWVPVYACFGLVWVFYAGSNWEAGGIEICHGKKCRTHEWISLTNNYADFWAINGLMIAFGVFMQGLALWQLRKAIRSLHGKAQ